MTSTKKFGTAPVFFTAISTILGAILFLRFGYAVGTLGIWGVVLIILLGHLVTIPTALAISEIATNKRVEGGGEYFIISRSFGLNIGATIGFALFISQAISVAFYVIAFTESFEFFFNWTNPWWQTHFNIDIPRQVISLPSMAILAILILKKGANLGVKALYVIVIILAFSLLMFFIGNPVAGAKEQVSFRFSELRNMDHFFVVFAIVFPAFTGMTAGVGLSGDLKNPAKSIPFGTIVGTLLGMIVYFMVTYKLNIAATKEDLTNNQLIMAKIALGGSFIIPLGLAASTISSALGSIMVAPRTLQALARDRAFPFRRLNFWLSRERKNDKEPVNASIITILIAFVFVAIGDVNAVARIISMFFMVTYGSLCLISFLNHFGSSPSYRPSFKSKWYSSLLGFIVAVWVMFKIDTPYALAAFVVMTLIYLYLNSYHKGRRGLQGIFSNAIYQLSRNLQIFVQKKRSKEVNREWRPSAICISKNPFNENKALLLLDWISHKFGFGTYLHHIVGYYSKSTVEESKKTLDELVKLQRLSKSNVYVETLISPSTTSAIAQAIQIPGISGMENNMIVFEYSKSQPNQLVEIIDNVSLVKAGNFDICIFALSKKPLDYKKGIHIWIQSTDTENANLLILLSYIILGHPSWKDADIKIFDVSKPDQVAEAKERMNSLIQEGRLPITSNNIDIIPHDINISIKSLIRERSNQAALTLIGFREETLKHQREKLFDGFDDLGDILFVNSHNQKVIE